MSLASFPAGYRALVIGASGAIGAALVARLQADTGCARVLALHRRSAPAIDFDTDAMKFKVRLDYGIAIGDWRAGYKNVGA